MYLELTDTIGHIMVTYFNATNLPKSQEQSEHITLSNGLQVCVWKDSKTGNVVATRQDTLETRHHSAGTMRKTLKEWEGETLEVERTESSAGQAVGYIRVSSVGQNTDRQLAGIKLDKVFEEKASAKTVDRPIWKQCVEFLREGDTLHIHSLDRVCRSGAGDALEVVETLTSKGVGVKFHKEGMEFYGTPTAAQRGVLNILASIAQMERELINERRREGQAEAKAKGKHIGRPKSKQVDKETMGAMLEQGMSIAAMARELGVSRQSLYRRLEEAGLR
jgi:DNA invertase Pin-like site-specific DNA recombinase